MNKEKFEKKVVKKYGVDSQELKDLSISKIKNLKVKNIEKIKTSKKYKFIKQPLGIIVKGASIGTGVAGCINTAFPDLIPVVGTYITTTSHLDNKAKFAILTFLSSLPADISSNYIILGIGAVLGSVLYSGYKLIKTGTNNLQVINDRGKAKKINRKK